MMRVKAHGLVFVVLLCALACAGGGESADGPAESEAPGKETSVQAPTSPPRPAPQETAAEENPESGAPGFTSPRAAYTNADGEMVGITRQGNEYIINPMRYGIPDSRVHPKSWAAAAAEPTGPPLSHNWREAKGASKRALPGADWYDPRTWESYRNFWGFDPPRADSNGVWPYRVRLDNWGTPLRMFDNVALVTHYTKRTGFRPAPQQLDRYLTLESGWKEALLDGDSSSAATLRQEIKELVSSAQGVLPNPYSYRIEFVGDPYSLEGPDPPEIMKERDAVAIRNLYKRMGIEHLYEFYETSKFLASQRNAGMR